MGQTVISFCDICGKRTTDLPGRITLSKQGNNGCFRGVWFKRMCISCLNNMTATKTKGDEIQECINVHLDKAYVNLKKNEVKGLLE